mmetsp:Transcript_60793/g.190637  ORF Transcript_60793/g.190637 Transcript_60793/m.190637 type:complete len:384 (-) Transcript_60793:331-1482(-)
MSFGSPSDAGLGVVGGGGTCSSCAGGGPAGGGGCCSGRPSEPMGTGSTRGASILRRGSPVVVSGGACGRAFSKCSGGLAFSKGFGGGGVGSGTSSGALLAGSWGSSPSTLSPIDARSFWSSCTCSSDIPHFSSMSSSFISRTAFSEPTPASMNFGKYSDRPMRFSTIRTSICPSSVFSASAAPSSTASSPTGGRARLQSSIHPPLFLEPGPSSLLDGSSARAATLFAKSSLSPSSRAALAEVFSKACSPRSRSLTSSRLALGSGTGTGVGGGGGGCCIAGTCGCIGMPGCCIPGICMPGCCIPGICMPGIALPCDCICCIIDGDHIMTSREYCSVPCVAARMRPRTTAVGSLAPMREPRARTSCWYSYGRARRRAAAWGSTGL